MQHSTLLGIFSSPVYAETDVKVMTYNVLLGFHRNHQLQQNRLDAAKTLIKHANPDILLLQEAFYAAPNSTGIVVNYQKEFSYPHTALAVWGDYGGNVTLSKYPIVESVILPLGSRNALRAKVNVDGYHTTIDNLHISPYITEQEKIAQLERIMRQEPHYILGGDFNAFSPHDTYERHKLVSDFKDFYGATGEVMLDDWLTCGAIKYILTHGLQDSGVFQSTYPTVYITKNKQGAMRIDFLFHSADMMKKDAWVETSSEAERASDHYPVVAVFSIR